jgi:hypothetical protein
MVDILNLALPYFSLIFIGFACGKARGLPETGLAWMNFFLLHVSLPALLFGIMSKTPFEELNNPPFLIATTLGTSSAFVLALFAGRLIGRLPLREATLAGLSGGYGADDAVCAWRNVALRPFGRVPWEVPGVIAVKPTRRVRIDAAIRTVRAAMGGHRGADGVASAGAECVRDRPAKRQLDRTGIRRRADRNLRIPRHAHQRDVVPADRPAGAPVKALADPPRRSPRGRQALAHGNASKRAE